MGHLHDSSREADQPGDTNTNSGRNLWSFGEAALALSAWVSSRPNLCLVSSRWSESKMLMRV